MLGKSDGDTLRVVGIGAGAWGSVFIAMLQEAYGHMRDQVQFRIWRRAGKALDRTSAQYLFDVINAREDVLRRLICKCAYLKYVEARLGDRILYADEILRDGFCINMLDTPLCPIKVVTNLQEAVWDADIVVNGLPSTETRPVFEEIGRYWRERRTLPVIISLAKGVEAVLSPVPHIITPTQMIHEATKVPIANILYLGGPNIASEVYNKEYANARICGSEKWGKPLASFLRQPHFTVWDNTDLVTHEVMGGLKNVYAIGAAKECDARRNCRKLEWVLAMERSLLGTPNNVTDTKKRPRIPITLLGMKMVMGEANLVLPGLEDMHQPLTKAIDPVTWGIRHWQE
eukprot:Gb_27759 [translate_table: standard]